MTQHFKTLIATLALLLTGCGQVYRNSLPQSLLGSYSVNNPSSSFTINSNQFACPSSPNVLPDYDSRLDGTGRYTVCATPSSKSRILVHGKTTSSKQICIYPAQVIDQKHVYVKPDLSTNLPWNQCSEIIDGGVTAQFDSIEFNAVFIVEEPDQAQMTSCLIGGNYYSCPTYSFGKFR